MAASHISNLVAGPSATKSLVVSVSTTSGQIAAVANPEGVSCVVKRIWLRTTTKSAAACTLDIGVAAGATTSSDNLLDGISVAGVPIGVYDNIENQGSNGRSTVDWPAASYVTVTVASGDANGLVGVLNVDYAIV